MYLYSMRMLVGLDNQLVPSNVEDVVNPRIS